MTRLLWLVALALATGCQFAGAEQAELERPTPPATATRVEVAELTPSDATLELSLPGEVEGSRDAVLAAALGGYVESVEVKEGDTVRSGQTLARIDAAIYAAQRDQAEAQVDQARDDLDRLQKLGDLAVSAQVKGAETALAVAEANLAQAKARLARAVISAPFAGIVAQVGVERGEVAGPGAPIFRVLVLDPIEVTLAVSDRDIVALTPGDPVSVSVASRARVWPGRVARVAPAADLRTRAFEVVVEVDNPDSALLPGMIARVTASRTLASDAVVIPQDWIVTTLSAPGVFLLEDDAAKWREVELGAVVYDQIEVTSGLSPGDRIVITGHRDLIDGDSLLVAREGLCCTDGRATFP